MIRESEVRILEKQKDFVIFYIYIKNLIKKNIEQSNDA